MAEPARMPAGARGSPHALAILWCVSIAVRLVHLAAIGPTRLVGDEHHYVTTARAIARGDGHWNPALRTAVQWPPGQAAFLAPFCGRSSATVADDTPAPRGAVLAALLAGSVLPVATHLLGTALFGPTTGLVAGAIAAVHPELVAYSQFLWSENLFAVLATLAAAMALRGGARPRITPLVSGLLLGLAILTREEGVLVALAVFAAWMVGAKRPTHALRRVAVAALVTVAVVTPWTVRNARLLGRFVPVSTAGWMGAAEGNLLGPSWLHREPGAVRDWRARYFAIDGDGARMDFARATALDTIATAQPAWLAKKLVLNLPRLWSPDSFLFRKLAVRASGPPSLGWVRVTLVVQVLAHSAVCGLALLALAADRERRRRWLGLLLIGSITALHVVANASSRYRLPLVPFLAVYAAAVAGGALNLRDLTRRQRATAVALTTCLLLCVATFAPKAVHLWQHGITPPAGSAE